MIVLGAVYRLGLMWENRKRDILYGVPTEEVKAEAIIKGFQDYTDKENTGFRYEL